MIARSGTASKPPNDPGRRMAADLAATIAAFTAQRDMLQFEDEPASFEAVLHAMRDTRAMTAISPI